MAIQFTTGTINQPTAPEVGRSMAQRIRDDIIAHPAWDLVEEYVPSVNTVTWYVFRCLASQSGLPNDFYVVMGCRYSDGAIGFWICEGYDPALHVSSFYPAVNNYYQTVAFDSYGRCVETYTLSTTLPNGASNQPQLPSWTPPGGSTSIKWWLIVTEDGFTIAWNGAQNGICEFGAYIPLCDMPVPMPIMHRYAGTTMFGLTQNPAVANLNYYRAALLWNAYGLGFGGRLDYNDKINGNQRIVQEWGMTILEYNPGDRQVQGWLLGKLKRFRVGSNPPGGFAFGDAYVMDNRLWVPYLPTDGGLWDTGVAAS